MRVLRTLLTGVAAAAVTLVVPPGSANAAPSSPYDAFTLEGWRSHALDPGSASISLTMWGAEGFWFTADPTDPARDSLNVGITAPTGSTLATGTFDILDSHDATHAGFLLSVGSSACTGSTGTITIHEVAREAGTGDVTAFAASYDSTCGGGVKGDLRWKSTVGYKAAVSDPANVSFGYVEVGETTPARTVTFTGRGTTPVTFGAASLTGTGAGTYTITANTCDGAVLDYGQTCTVKVVAHPASTGDTSAVLVIPDDTTAGGRRVPLGASPQVGERGTFTSVPPARIMDTRSGLGVRKGPVGADSTVRLKVTGGSLPPSGVAAVVLNVTVVTPTSSGYVTVYPAGVERPNASSLNFRKGWVGANSVTVAVGTSGEIDFYNLAGQTQIVADVTGYYAADNTPRDSGYGHGGHYQPVSPQRFYDTRISGTKKKLTGGHYLNIWAKYRLEDNPHIRAFVVNITAVSPDRDGYITAWNGDPYAFPETSTLNYAKGTVVPNMAVIPVSPCQDCGKGEGMPSIGVYTSATSHLLVDIIGVFDDGTLADGLRFIPITPTRIADSRIGQGIAADLGPATTATVTTPEEIGSADTQALAVNLTAVAPTAAGTFVTVWPDGARPTVSTLNPAKGQTVPNAAIPLLTGERTFNVYNSVGTTGIVIDVVGTYYLYPGTASPAFAGPGFAGRGASVHPLVLSEAGAGTPHEH